MNGNGFVHGSPHISFEADELLAKARGFEEHFAKETNEITHASSALEAAWKEECAAAERLRDAQTAAARAAHDLSLRQHERISAANALIDLRKRLEYAISVNADRSTPDAPETSAAGRFKRLRTWLIAPLLAVLVCGFSVWAWTASNVRVCSTSMTGGVARDLLRAYEESHSNFPYHYTLVPGDARPCDVRFSTTTSDNAGSLIARDALVAIVNPRNRIRALTASQLRDIFAGRITNWSKVGGSPAPIVAAIPPDGSDEARAAQAFLNEPIAPTVQRSPASDILTLIAGPSGSHAIGFVPFSSAFGAKVVAISGSPAPSALSIAHEQYPLSVGLAVESDFREPNAGASDLMAFARSHDAHLVMDRAQLITKGTALASP